MNARTGDFLRAEATRLKPDSLKMQLALEECVRLLYAELVKNTDALKYLHPLERSLRHDLMNVLLRYDQPAEWRAFAEATKDRKASNAGVADSFKKLSAWFASLVEGGSPNAYPLRKALVSARSSVDATVRNECGEAELTKWKQFLDEMEAALRSAALREWLCLSLRRTLDERNIHQTGVAGGE